MRLNGFHIADNGTLARCEMYGPPNLEVWERAYKVLATVLIMQEAVRPGELDRYEAMIREFVNTYGVDGWPTIYQADVRCRQERMQTLRRKGMRLHNIGPNSAIAAGFDLARPGDMFGAPPCSTRSSGRKKFTSNVC